MATKLTIEQAADAIIAWAKSDSQVDIDRAVLVQQLEEDEGFSGRIPTDEECEVLVTGGDGGDEFEELEEFFPKTSDFIGSYWA